MSVAEIIFLDPERPYWIDAEAVIPVPGGSPLTNGFLSAQRGRIESVGTDRSLVPAIFRSPSCERLHLEKMVLFPALVDGHVHLGLREISRALDAVEQCLGSGIAALRDGGDRAAATLHGAEMLYSGQESPLGSLAAGKRSHFLGLHPNCIHRPIRPEDVRCVVALREWA